MMITEFLEARIAEDEAGARGALEGASDDGLWHVGLSSFDGGSERVTGKGILIYDEGGHTEGQAAHIARWDPARALADCAVKRRILAFDRNVQIWEPRGFSSDTAAEAFVSGGPKDVRMRHVTRILASVYADHPDYQQEWAL